MVPFGFGLIYGFGFASALRRRGAGSDHGRCRGVAGHLETPAEPHVYHALGTGVFSSGCAIGQFLGSLNASG
jgi:hypothetical protein